MAKSQFIAAFFYRSAPASPYLTTADASQPRRTAVPLTVIVATGTSASVAAKAATSTVPIVFEMGSDPVRLGVVSSLNRPGGNITGLSVLSTDLAGKRIELLREAVRGLRHLAIMGNASNPVIVLEMREFQKAASALGFGVTMLEIRRAEDIAPAFEALKGHAEALYICQDPLTFTNRVRINTLALGFRVPAMFASREHVEAGSLMSYGPNFPDLYRRAA